MLKSLQIHWATSRSGFAAFRVSPHSSHDTGALAEHEPSVQPHTKVEEHGGHVEESVQETGLLVKFIVFYNLKQNIVYSQ